MSDEYCYGEGFVVIQVQVIVMCGGEMVFELEVDCVVDFV